MKIAFSKPSLPETGVVVTLVEEGAKLCASSKLLDDMTGGAISRAIKSENFQGKSGQVLRLLAPIGLKYEAIYLLGIGEAKKLDLIGAQNLGGGLYAAVASTQPRTLSVAVDDLETCPQRTWEVAANVALGMLLRSYRFDKYKTKLEDADKPSIGSLKILTTSAGRARSAFETSEQVARGVFMTRDLVSEPANVIYPQSLAEQALTLRDLGVEVDVLGEEDMRKLNMNALLGVGQGSANESRLVVMRWNGLGKPTAKRTKAHAPLAFVGKGVTFDTGGISIKPAAGMEDMKWDMGGAGVVIGLMRALAERKARSNVVGVVGLVENMPSGTAQRPGDVVTSANGQTIEVINTDAEGRLVLADALWYTQKHYEPRAIIDLATLTGAIIIALGDENAGVFSNDDTLAKQIEDASKVTGEGTWRLPLSAQYDKMINSDIADMKNVGGRGAGSITAAQFLKRFINDGTPWAHIDIAGMAWSSKDRATCPKGGTGFGVRLLDQLVAKNYEGK